MEGTSWEAEGLDDEEEDPEIAFMKKRDKRKRERAAEMKVHPLTSLVYRRTRVWGGIYHDIS